MTELQEKLKLIADYMEYVGEYGISARYSKAWFDGLKYHTSLDRLHPVVQKIGKTTLKPDTAYKYILLNEQPTIFDDISVWFEWVVKVIMFINKQWK